MTDNENNTPLRTAIVNARFTMAQELLTEGAEMGDSTSPNSLFSTSRRCLEAQLEHAEKKIQTNCPEEEDTLYFDSIGAVVNHWLLSRFAMGHKVSTDDASDFYQAAEKDIGIHRGTYYNPMGPELDINHYRSLKALLAKALDGTIAEWPAFIGFTHPVTEADTDRMAMRSVVSRTSYRRSLIDRETDRRLRCRFERK